MLTKDDAERFKQAKARMRALVGARIFDCWFIPLQANDLKTRKATGKSLLLSVPTASPRHSIATHYMNAVETACKEQWPDLDHIAIAIRVLGQEPAWGPEDVQKNGSRNRSSDITLDDMDDRLKAYAPMR